LNLPPERPPTCSVIIATLDRLDSLRVVLECLGRQTQPPLEVIIAAAGLIAPVEELVRRQPASFPVRVLACSEKSSARQRNAAAAQAEGAVLAFLDDDIEFQPDLFARMLLPFAGPGPAPGAISARIAGEDRPTPGRLARTYYRLQSGHDHADYGGLLFGAGINCYPVFRPDSPALFPSGWLPATCLFVRADLFHAERFPAFDGYSFAEDVHLSARIGRSAPLYFATHCLILHHSLPSEFKRDPAALTAGKLHNQARIAREILGLRGWSLGWRWQAHRLFLTLATLRSRPPRWSAILRGIWTAHL
jgi:glycosyltransferase involved in cell wall biosynthesis